MKKLNDISDAEFDAKLVENRYVLVDFWADWCIPCRQVSPIVEEIAEENPQMTVFKMNIDENPETPKRFDIKSIPTLLLFENGELRARVVGAKSKQDILNEIAY